MFGKKQWVQEGSGKIVCFNRRKVSNLNETLSQLCRVRHFPNATSAAFNFQKNDGNKHTITNTKIQAVKHKSACRFFVPHSSVT